MTDEEIIKKLRNTEWWHHDCELRMLAAERIHTLIAERDKYKRFFELKAQSAVKLRARADKAEAILRVIEPAIRADEREACARVADEYVEANQDYGTVSYSALPAIARAIRARGDTP